MRYYLSPWTLRVRVEDSDVYDSGSGVGGAKAATWFKVYLHWAPKYVNITYIGLFGALE